MSQVLNESPTDDARPFGDGVLYEVVDGKPVELEPMGAYEIRIASTILCVLENACRAGEAGRAVSEMLFTLNESLNRRPDVAYVSYERWAKKRRIPRTNAWNVVPDLAVEVISQTNSFDEIEIKTHDYFAAGVQQVWVISPAKHQVYVFVSPTESRILSLDDSLTAIELLPEFELSLAELFEIEADQDD